MSDEYIPRISVDVTQENYDRYTNLLPWGLRSKVIQLLIGDLLDLIESEGDIVLTAIINRVITSRHIMQGLNNKGGEDGIS